MNIEQPSRNKEAERDVEQPSSSLSAYFGITVGSLFLITGFLIILKILGSGWWINFRIRIILGVTIILFGIFRIVQYSFKLVSARKRKSLKEQLDELENQ